MDIFNQLECIGFQFVKVLVHWFHTELFKKIILIHYSPPSPFPPLNLGIFLSIALLKTRMLKKIQFFNLKILI